MRLAVNNKEEIILRVGDKNFHINKSTSMSFDKYVAELKNYLTYNVDSLKKPVYEALESYFKTKEVNPLLDEVDNFPKVIRTYNNHKNNIRTVENELKSLCSPDFIPERKYYNYYFKSKKFEGNHIVIFFKMPNYMGLPGFEPGTSTTSR